MGVGIRHNRLVVVLPDLCGGQLDNKYKPKKCPSCACALKHGPKNYKCKSKNWWERLKTYDSRGVVCGVLVL